MKLSTAIIISGLTLLIGFVFSQPLLWLPTSILIAGLIDLFTRSWVASDRLGQARTMSMLLKFTFALVGFYAMLGQLICIGLITWWLVF